MKSVVLKMLCNIKNKGKILKYYGNERYCPICNKASKVFLSFGVPPRKDAQCPFCNSLERDRLSWLFIQKKTNFFQNHPNAMLHIAPESIFKSRFEKLLGSNYITADLYRTDVTVKMDISSIQYPDDSFDCIYCSHVLEHVPNDIQAMQELKRVLSPNGWAILLVPISGDVTYEDLAITDPQLRVKLYGQEDHVRQYGKDYIDRLRDAGFTVQCIQPVDFLTQEEIISMGITTAASDIYFCTS